MQKELSVSQSRMRDQAKIVCRETVSTGGQDAGVSVMGSVLTCWDNGLDRSTRKGEDVVCRQCDRNVYWTINGRQHNEKRSKVNNARGKNQGTHKSDTKMSGIRLDR